MQQAFARVETVWKSLSYWAVSEEACPADGGR